jgi:membrane protein YqaA with SNARE-associated domain
MTSLAIYASLFAIAFLSATILPLQSEAVFVALLLKSEQSPALLLCVASLANTLGSAVNWYLGRAIERFRGARWFPVDDEKLARAQNWYHRWGKWSLLLSWAPVFGDGLTVMAGVMREPAWTFLAIVGFAKSLRYAIVMALTFGFFG